MIRQAKQYGVVGLVAGLVLASVGCSSAGTSATQIRMQTLCSAGLDECREIALTYDRLWDRDAGNPERTYELLRVVVKPREPLSFEQTSRRSNSSWASPAGSASSRTWRRAGTRPPEGVVRAARHFPYHCDGGPHVSRNDRTG